MRRRLLFVAPVAAAAVLLSGCASGSGAETPTTSGTSAPSSTETSTGDSLCDSQVASGSASDAVTVDGEPGEESTAQFEAPLEFTEVEVSVVDEGEGDPMAEGDWVTYGISAFDASTGDPIEAIGYTAGELLPVQLSATNTYGQLFGCASVGERIVAAFPSQDGSAGQVYVMDLLSHVPTAAWGTEEEQNPDLPQVTLAEDGEPSVEIGSGEAPSETTIETLKLGDGETVAEGDEVLVQYKGVLFADGTEFDSSWSRGTPTSFVTTDVVTGFSDALVGQTVGSQVLAVIPPEDGYGDVEQGSIPAGSTLVFVVDILGTAHATATDTTE